MALGAEIVDLVRLHLLDNSYQIGGIRQVAVMEYKPGIIDVGILIKVINAVGVEAAGPSLDAVHHITLLQ